MNAEKHSGHDCRSCGMHLESPLEFHPYAACLMFHTCRDGGVVRANLGFAVEYGARAAERGLDIDWVMNNINWPDPDGEE